jgi:hypothetical protein
VTAAPSPRHADDSPAGECRQVTILFADLCGFTAISRTLDPEEVRELVGRYTALVDGIVVGYGGTVDKHFSLPSGVDCSLGRYKVLTKIFAPNSQASDLPWSAQESNHSFLRLLPR